MSVYVSAYVYNYRHGYGELIVNKFSLFPSYNAQYEGGWNYDLPHGWSVITINFGDSNFNFNNESLKNEALCMVAYFDDGKLEWLKSPNQKIQRVHTDLSDRVVIEYDLRTSDLVPPIPDGIQRKAATCTSSGYQGESSGSATYGGMSSEQNQDRPHLVSSQVSSYDIDKYKLRDNGDPEREIEIKLGSVRQPSQPSLQRFLASVFVSSWGEFLFGDR